MRDFPFQKLVDWYKKNGRKNLPWRDYNILENDLAYYIWLSEILLQQTQASRGISYFENIIAHYKDIHSLAHTSYEEFFEYYKGLGYYSRARNLLKTAKIISEKYLGVFPKDTKKLVSLPGVGPYTAEAIRAFAFEIPTLSFDTNLEKIFSRYYFGDRNRKLSKGEKQKILKSFLQSQVSSRDFNNAAMDFGALISKNNVENIDWEKYPLEDSKFFQTKGNLEPKKINRKTGFPNDEAIVIVILHENHKEYFSKNEEKYEPFILEKTSIKDKRAYIKDYFFKKYNLELSVRPAYKKDFQNKKPYMLFNAQIQRGENSFFIHKKEYFNYGNIKI